MRDFIELLKAFGLFVSCLVIGAGRSGRDAVWIITESHESAVYIDTLEPLSQEEITKEFL